MNCQHRSSQSFMRAMNTAHVEQAIGLTSFHTCSGMTPTTPIACVSNLKHINVILCTKHVCKEMLTSMTTTQTLRAKLL
jgi:hypothetical protein